jgi:hypothetical protein
VLEAESNQGHSETGRIRSTENSNDLTGNRTLDFPVCSIVPQPTMPLPASYINKSEKKMLNRNKKYHDEKLFFKEQYLILHTFKA